MADERVLVVDDELSMREFLAILLGREGYDVRLAASGEAALEALAAEPFDLMLTDLSMPGIDGMELVQRIRGGLVEDAKNIPIVMVTAYGTTASAVEAMKVGANDYVLKPFNNDELLIVLRKAVGHRALERENVQLRRELQKRFGYHKLIGTSEPMEAVYEMIRRVKDSRISCLVQGDSGTGKELVARAIHYSGARSAGPFIPVNCGAIPESLIESELFGYKKGAFTGALRDKDGFFRAAHGGTLFLDEIGEMPLQAQVRLLRAIAERRVVAVGDTVERAVDARIIAATNRDLHEEIKAGRFREDLYYRLNVVRIELPPLRKRGEDIAMLAEHFVEHYANEHGKNIRGLEREAMAAMKSYSWPGNVRELQNAIEGAVALETDSTVGLRSLPHRLAAPVAAGAPSSSAVTVAEAAAPFPSTGMDLDELLSSVERSWLEKALEYSSGNKTRAAQLLGMSFRSFRYRLAKYGMDEP